MQRCARNRIPGTNPGMARNRCFPLRPQGAWSPGRPEASGPSEAAPGPLAHRTCEMVTVLSLSAAGGGGDLACSNHAELMHDLTSKPPPLPLSLITHRKPMSLLPRWVFSCSHRLLNWATRLLTGVPSDVWICKSVLLHALLSHSPKPKAGERKR